MAAVPKIASRGVHTRDSSASTSRLSICPCAVCSISVLPLIGTPAADRMVLVSRRRRRPNYGLPWSVHPSARGRLVACVGEVQFRPSEAPLDWNRQRNLGICSLLRLRGEETGNRWVPKKMRCVNQLTWSTW
jgi:hypothetical protein